MCGLHDPNVGAMTGLDWIQDDSRKNNSSTHLLALLRGDGPLILIVSVQDLRYIPQGRRFGGGRGIFYIRSRSKVIRRQSYVLVWSEVSMVVEVLTQRSRFERTYLLNYANAAPVLVRPHN